MTETDADLVRARIRVVLGPMSELLEGIVRDVVSNQSDIEIVARLDDRDLAQGAAARLRADVLVLAADGAATARLCSGEGDLRIVGIEADGRRAFVCYSDVSADDLRRAIRAAGRAHVQDKTL